MCTRRPAVLFTRFSSLQMLPNRNTPLSFNRVLPYRLPPPPIESNLPTIAQRAAEKRMWDAAFTIQSAHRRMHVRRRRRARALKHAMGASNAAAAWNQALEHGQKKTETAAAATEEEMDGGNVDVGGLATSGGGTGGTNDREQLGSTAIASPPAHGSNDKTASGVTKTNPRGVETPGTTVDEGNRVGGQEPASSTSANAPDAAAPAEPEYEDLGDVALAAVLSARKPAPTPLPSPPSPPMPAPAVVVQEPARAVVEAKPASATPPQEATLEYYEAKMRYLAAQEKAHGASACKIQASKRATAALLCRLLVLIIDALYSVFSQG